MHNLEINTLCDGIFHASTYVLVAMGLVILWRAGRRPHAPWPARALIATILTGFGIFNLVEGIVDHQVLGLHHVNETVPRAQWIYWDVGFLISGAAMLLGRWLLLRSSQGVNAA